MTLLNKKRLKSWSDDHELEADEKVDIINSN